MSTDQPTELPPPADPPRQPDPVSDPIGEQAMQKWDAGMDRLNAENLIALRQQQVILRDQGNDEGAAALEAQVARIPLSDEIKADPRGFLDSQDTPSNPVAPPVSDVRTEAALTTSGSNGGGDSGIRQEPLGDVNYSYVKREPVVATNWTKDRPPQTAGEALSVQEPGHVAGLYDRRDIGSPVESAGQPTRTDLPANDQIIDGVNRFYRDGKPSSDTPDGQYLWNCSACVKAVDSRLAGTEPDAYAGYLADPPGTANEAWVTDAVFEETLEREWGTPIQRGSAADVGQDLLDAGPGARGVLVCDGHVANVINRDGSVIVLDGQTGDSYPLDDYPANVRGYIRTDSGR